MTPWTRLAADVATLGLTLDPGFEPRARVFVEELGRWRAIAHLTGYRTLAEQVEHLVLESLLLLAVLPEAASPLLDIGSGAGAPGLILKLARPEWAVGLVEANRRRANFLRHVARRLDLTGLEVHAARAEMLARDATQQTRYRTVTLRAVAPWPAPLTLARPFLAPEGRVILQIGPGVVPPWGVVRRVTLAHSGRVLPLRRAFLIIGATEVSADVSRGTGRVRGPRPGRGQPEGRGGQDDDRRESRRRPGRRRPGDAPRGPRSPGERDRGRLA